MINQEYITQTKAFAAGTLFRWKEKINHPPERGFDDEVNQQHIRRKFTFLIVH